MLGVDVRIVRSKLMTPVAVAEGRAAPRKFEVLGVELGGGRAGGEEEGSF
jgi:hypothetical protein